VHTFETSFAVPPILLQTSMIKSTSPKTLETRQR